MRKPQTESPNLKKKLGHNFNIYVGDVEGKSEHIGISDLIKTI